MSQRSLRRWRSCSLGSVGRRGPAAPAPGEDAEGKDVGFDPEFPVDFDRRFLLRIALMGAAERECEAEKKRIYILFELFHWTDLGSKGTRMIPGSGLIAEVRS